MRDWTDSSPLQIPACLLFNGKVIHYPVALQRRAERMLKLFKKKPETKIYDNVQNFSFDTVCALLANRNKGRDPDVMQSVAAMGSCVAATRDFMGVLSPAMPTILKRVNADIFAMECLAFVTPTITRAVYLQRSKERATGLDRIWLPLSSTPRTIKDQFIERSAPGLGAIWLERWKEYRNTEDLSDRFGLLCYLLYTSSGYDLIQERYPKSPPTILELFFGIEQMLAYSAGLQSILNSVENFKKVDAVMPDFDPFDDEDELLGEDDDDL
ncbi:hypothetical protein [Novosphingobium acidiphilum]|uniref:hypothetical protein n=1 Tax=Novosphingobium acidiphilum TaxID=505248 RepID=UPI0012EBBC60|nr:hypothetical protein [Novosphingobium acidiphilum]